MATKLKTFEPVEIRSVIRFLWSKGKKPAEIHRELCATYGETCMPLTNISNWCAKFTAGRQSVLNEQRSGRPQTSHTQDNIDAVNAVIQRDRRSTIKSVAREVDISYGTAFQIIHEDLQYRKVSARWVPRQLTQLHMENRMAYSLEHLFRYHREGHAFLERIVTGDEKWAFHYTPETKQQSMVWKHTNSPPPKKFKTRHSAGKVMVTVFWDSQGVVLCDFLPKGETVNAPAYSATLDRLRAAMRRKRPQKPMDKIIILHDNARPHVAALVSEKLRSWKWEVLQHPAYSPDLAPSDYHLFGPLTQHLAGTHFNSDDEVKTAVRSWLRSQPNEFYAMGIEKLVSRWDKCINVNGGYVEK